MEVVDVVGVEVPKKDIGRAGRRAVPGEVEVHAKGVFVLLVEEEVSTTGAGNLLSGPLNCSTSKWHGL